jgi:hypothetical protein
MDDKYAHIHLLSGEYVPLPRPFRLSPGLTSFYCMAEEHFLFPTNACEMSELIMPKINQGPDRSQSQTYVISQLSPPPTPGEITLFFCNDFQGCLIFCLIISTLCVQLRNISIQHHGAFHLFKAIGRLVLPDHSDKNFGIHI